MYHPPDHGLPLVQLKERRREIVTSLRNRVGHIGDDELRLLATIQQAILALEDVISDLDCEYADGVADHRTHSFAPFGRHAALHSPV